MLYKIKERKFKKKNFKITHFPCFTRIHGHNVNNVFRINNRVDSVPVIDSHEVNDNGPGVGVSVGPHVGGATPWCHSSDRWKCFAKVKPEPNALTSQRFAQEHPAMVIRCEILPPLYCWRYVRRCRFCVAFRSYFVK